MVTGTCKRLVIGRWQGTEGRFFCVLDNQVTQRNRAGWSNADHPACFYIMSIIGGKSCTEMEEI